MEEISIAIIVLLIIFIICAILTISMVLIWKKDKKIYADARKQLEQNEDTTMPAHVKMVYSTYPHDRIMLVNCPHCTGAMLTLHDEAFTFYCPRCDVYWRIQLIDKPGIKTEGAIDDGLSKRSNE